MRRLQDVADAEKIGGVLRRIMAKSKAFSLEALYSEDGTITDPDDVARIVTEFYRLWFTHSRQTTSEMKMWLGTHQKTT